MPRVIEVEDEAASSLDECIGALGAMPFDPADEESLAHAALQLRCLGNNRQFLGDLMLGQLKERHREDDSDQRYGPQAIMIAPSNGNFFMRANIWPSEQDHMMRASGDASFVYGLPHDHNFNFLTLGYFGPGYWSDYYEYDYGAVAGYCGEPVPGLRFIERARLDPGKIMLYRAHVDVHAQLPADSLSVSLNVMHVCAAQGWLDQYSFDLEKREVGRIVSNGSNDAFIRIAVGLGSAEALDLAHRFARHHPSDRMRLHALDALASVALDAGECDKLWEWAETGGSRMVAMEAKARRAALERAA